MYRASLEYGPERMGYRLLLTIGSVTEPITVHSNIYEPDYVVVVDESLLETIDVTKGLKKDGAVIINSERSKEELREHLHGYEGAVYTVNAKQISLRTLGRNYPNSPMLAAVAVSNVMERKEFLQEMRASFQHKFAKKPEVIDGNMQALELAFEEAC